MTAPVDLSIDLDELRSNADVLERFADRAYSADLERRAAHEIARLRSALTAAESQRDEGLAHEGAKDLRISELEQQVRTFEAALRGDMGVLLEDGYHVNVAALKHALNQACGSCGCSILERASGHRTECLVPQWQETLKETFE